MISRRPDAHAALPRVAQIAVRARRFQCRAPRAAGRPAGRGRVDEGPIVCVCFQVGCRPHRCGAIAEGYRTIGRSERVSAPAPICGSCCPGDPSPDRRAELPDTAPAVGGRP
jgi:hypothetical protein